MEIRELKYFLAVAREESISKAAKVLYVTQPNLSRQMQNLENEIGAKLFIRGNRRVTLTETGRVLKKRAEEIVDLYNKTQAELKMPQDEIVGEITIGSGESYALSSVVKVVKNMQAEYPKVKFNIFSGDSGIISEKLDNGLIDFGVFIEPFDVTKYDYLRLPLQDTWGILMRKDSPLAQKDKITPEDLWDLPLIRSRQSLGKNKITEWFKKNEDELNIVATYNLLYNASIMVREGIGYAVTLDKIINITDSSDLIFKPLYPELKSYLNIAWKKYSSIPKCAEMFLGKLKNELQ